jgi:hypothetical protein
MTTLNPDKDEFILVPATSRERKYAPLESEAVKQRRLKRKKVNDMQKQVGEYRCTKCGETVILPVGDSTPFKCKKCGGEECLMNFSTGMAEQGE